MLQLMRSDSDKADPRLYRLYWRYCLTDILNHLGFEPNKVHKECVHAFHKRILNYKTTQNITQGEMEMFIFNVCLFWAERGVFVRTKKGQPEKILQLPLSVCWKWL
jgi:hypothetical protein